MSDEADPIIVGTDIHANVEEAITALERDPNVFQRDGVLVQVTHETTPHSTKIRRCGSEVVRDMPPRRSVFRQGTPHVRELKIATLTERLSVLATWQKPKRERSGEVVFVAVKPPRDVVDAVAARGEWKAIPPLTGIAETPFLRPDGSVCDVKGYDQFTGYLYEPSGAYTRSAADVDQAEAAAALKKLAVPFQEFPWISAAAMYVPVAAVLTMIARPAIDGPVPLIALDKTTPGTGGTLTADGISLIATGRTAPRLSWPPDDTELEKVLGALALGAANLVCFDNVATPLRGGPLDKVLTCDDRVQLRVLGASHVPSVKWRAMIVATGNNMAIEGDTGRRCLVARQESPLERPEERTGFRIPNLRDWITLHRAELVDAALTVLRGYVAAGYPDMKLRPWGSFESWASLIPAAIVWAGGPDVMQARILDADKNDPERAAIVTVCRRLPALAADGMSLRSLVATLYPVDRDRTPGPPDGWDDLRGALEVLGNTPQGKAPDAKKLAYALRKWKGRVIGGRRLTSTVDRTNAHVWAVEGAGDAGHAGDVSAPARESDSCNVSGDGLEHHQHHQHHQHKGTLQ